MYFDMYEFILYTIVVVFIEKFHATMHVFKVKIIESCRYGTIILISPSPTRFFLLEITTSTTREKAVMDVVSSLPTINFFTLSHLMAHLRWYVIVSKTCVLLSFSSYYYYHAALPNIKSKIRCRQQTWRWSLVLHCFDLPRKISSRSLRTIPIRLWCGLVVSSLSALIIYVYDYSYYM